MQATTTPKLADHRPAYQIAFMAVALAAAIAVGGAIGIALQAAAPASPATGDYEASGVRRAPVGALLAPSQDFLDGAAVRRDQSGISGNVAPIRGVEYAPTSGGLLWTGTNPGVSTGGGDDPKQVDRHR